MTARPSTRRGRGGARALRTAARRYVKPVVGERAWNYARQLNRRFGAGTATAGGPTELTAAQLAAMSSDLTALAKYFKTDKWGTHRYTPHYQRHFERFRNQRVRVFEVGIGGDFKNRIAGASLRMWKHYFPKGQIVGLDIEDRFSVAEDRIKVYQGDQSDPAILHRINDECGPFDIIIDDGSHRVFHVLPTFEVLFPLLKDGGIYVIEDIQSSYWPEWGGSEDLNSTETSMALCKRLADGLNYEEFVDESYEPSYTDRNVVGVHFYHNLVLIEKGTNKEGTNKRRALRKRYAKAADAS